MALATAAVLSACSSTTPSPASTPEPSSVPVPAAFIDLGSRTGDSATSTATPDGRVYVGTSWGMGGDTCGPSSIGAVGSTSITWHDFPGSVDVLAASNDLLVAIGRDDSCNPTSFVSSNGGEAWSSKGQDPFFRPSTLVGVGRTFIAAGGASFWTSADGLTWTKSSTTVGLLAATPRGLLIGADASGNVLGSSDLGRVWTPIDNARTPSNVTSSAANDAAMVLGTDQGAPFVTLEALAGTTANIETVASGRVVAVAAGGKLLVVIVVVAGHVELTVLNDLGERASVIVTQSPPAGPGLNGTVSIGADGLVIGLANPSIGGEHVSFMLGRLP